MKHYKRYLARSAGLLLAGAVLPASGGDAESDQLALCKSELKKVYGKEARLKLQGIQRSYHGSKMRISAYADDGSSHRTTCWVDREGMVNLVDRDGADLLASANASGEDDVTFNP